MKNKNLLDKYIARLLALKEQKRDEFSDSDLKEIALEVGLTDSDLEQAQEEALKHFERGQTYVQVKHWDKAEKEFELAAELEPLNPQMTFELANFYFSKWQKTKNKNDLKLAESEANKYLYLNPKHQISIDLVRKIESSKGKKKQFSKAKKGFFTFLFLLPAIIGASLLILNEIAH